jgi:hypothetical protein
VIDGDRPHVLIVGGFLTSPPLYWGMRDALLTRDVASVSISPVWTPDWVLAGWVGLGPLMRRTGQAVVRAYRQGGHRPLLVIGHSAGGVLARLAMSPEPFQGRGPAWRRHTGARHARTPIDWPSSRPAEPVRLRGTSYLERTIPGAWFAPDRVPDRRVTLCDGGPPATRIGAGVGMGLCAMVGGESARTGWGDRLIPEASPHRRRRPATLDGVVHGQSMGARWYGSGPVMDSWWPTALVTWREGVAARDAGIGTAT